jgi:hypothetical protein
MKDSKWVRITIFNDMSRLMERMRRNKDENPDLSVKMSVHISDIPEE